MEQTTKPAETTETTPAVNENKPLSLADRLKMATQQKTPGTNVTPSVTPTTTTPTTKTAPAPNKKSGSFWNSDDDFEETKTPETKNETADKKSDTDFRSSAETTVSLVDFGMNSIFGPIARYQLKKKFTDDEWPRVKEIQYADKSKLNADDLKLRNKIDTEIKKYRAKLKEIEMDTDEISKNERAWYTYFKTTNSTISPGWLAASSLITTIGKRITNTLLDD